MSKIPLAGLLFLIFNPIVSQFNKAAFEKNYLEFHEKWEAGYDCSLKEIETLFDQCPDLSQYPHYYLYKGDLLSSKGYSDLALKYYLLGEKYNALGYENKNIYDHTPIFYFKLGYNYAVIDAQVDFKKYIDKLKAYVGTTYTFHAMFHLNELQAIYKFKYSNKKEEAVVLLEKIYDSLLEKPKHPLYATKNITRIRTIAMAIDLGDLEKAGRFLQEVKNESWSSTIDGDHLRDYFTTFSNYYYNKKQYPKALAYNDSIRFTFPIAIEDQEEQYVNYIRIYKKLNENKLIRVYTDSLDLLHHKQRDNRIASVVLLTQENKKNETLIDALDLKSKKQTSKIVFTGIISMMIFIATVYYMTKRRVGLEKKLNNEALKNKILNKNFYELLGKHQLTITQFKEIEKAINKTLPDKRTFAYFSTAIKNNLVSKIDLNSSSLDTQRELFLLDFKKKHPFLTPHELLICFYTKMGLTGKEIAQVTNKSLRSVESHQYRIKRKIN